MKPDNVLITRENVVKVMDLGVARGAQDDARVTQTGAFVGSLQYAAPEQFTDGGKGLDGRADLHALGVLLYELSTGANPYQDADWRVVFQRVLKETPRRLGAVNPQVSPFFEEVVHTLLAKDRDARFASAAELASVLEAGEDSPWWSSKARSIRGATKRPLRRIKIPRDTALVGRDAEMAKLRAAFEKCKAGDGQVVLVEGEAGIGKSRLVDEFVALLQREGEDLGFLYGSYPPGGAATASGAFTTAYREHFGEEGLFETLAAYLGPSPVLIPAFAAMLRGETTPAGAEPLTKDSIQTCFVHATRAIAAERIAVVLIDDLHFAPDEGKALFASLAMAAPGHRILLVGTSRPPLDEKWTANIVRVGHTTRIPVGRLGAKDLVALLKDALKASRLAEELAAKIASSTDGNPFFVFEVLRGLKDGHYLTQKPDGTWATTRIIHEIRIPSSIADMIQARIADLSGDERSLLEIAACAGFEFDPALVGDVAGLGRIPLLRTLGAVEKQHRLIRGAGRRYVFDHHQVQEHLYAGLTEFAREGYHAAIADSLDRMNGAASKDPTALPGALSADLCEHSLKAAQGERALRYLEAAQAHLTKGYQHAQVAALTERALALPDLLAGVGRARALLALTAALAPLGRRARQIEAAGEAARLAEAAGDDELLARATSSLGVAYSATSQRAQAEASFRKLLEIAQARADKQTEADAENGLASEFYYQGRYAEAQAHWERALAFSRETGDERLEAGVIANLGNIHSVQGRHEEALRHYERGLAMDRKVGNRRWEAIAIGSVANELTLMGFVARAREQQERCLALHRDHGDRRGEAIALVNLGYLSMLLGDPARGRQEAEAALATSREAGARYPEGYALQMLGFVRDAEGDAAGALASFGEALALRRAIGHAAGIVDSQIEIAELQLASRDFHAARPALDEALRLARDQGRAPKVALVLAMLAGMPGGAPRDRGEDALASPGAMVAAAVAALAGIAENEDSMRTHLYLWKAAGDRAHLAEARRLLDASLARVPGEHHAAMLANVRVNRETAAAAKAAGP